mmetsp:Transcript_6388/g.10074  ORF Transcript_6388/g.10074 Transcript_6388/m.10074 type:complete len:231 (+) Transcript_6388:133-825(+)|eukprot:CAMPEP_0203761378 /NCGR_PEP_ID=MMETSP0098-20131031/14480_1 /ASSEMBLY_ACC=CAM_ASM_000208 /TAXON_ID=96639 /ORGANISM=" , Strain NY0313808BC1" /LENGTH=230 /DNA_ID=CAMNT_0050655353 /DNA_START=142 /DNA_END=834 /DNA_ORIENTATION=-
MSGRRVLVSSSSEGESSLVESWIEWFCKQEGNEFFCEVDRRYIEDNFNLYGLREVIGQGFKKCLDHILDRSDDGIDDVMDDNMERRVQDLYGLIHARFIITKRGQEKMRRKLKELDFGICPSLPCQQNPVLPVGLRDELGISGAMIYCPRCNNIYLPASRCGYRADDGELDGAYFGTTFPHLFMMQYSELWPQLPIKTENYVPRCFGFKVRLPKRTYDDDAVMQDDNAHK